MGRRGAQAATGLLALLAFAPAAQAGVSFRYCDPSREMRAEEKDKLFQFGAIIKRELDASGAQVAIMARSGLDLSRFGLRYSHAGISLKANPEGAWAIRQLYYSCDEKLPRVFDQGVSAFLTGTDQPAMGYVSVLLLLPAASAQALEQAALDKALALRLLAARYSANAYAFSTQYQNCNQWVAEMLAAAWGGRASDGPSRAEAQQWLQAEGYVPSTVDVGWRVLMWVGATVPWIFSDDHPAEDLQALRYRVSMPAAIEDFVRRRLDSAGSDGTVQRLEFCHNSRHVVVHRGWAPIAEGCEPAAGDELITLQD